MKTFDYATTADAIRASMESYPVQEAIAAFFDRNPGRRIDKRFLDRLNTEVGVDCWLVKRSGTYLEWGAGLPSDDPGRGSLTLSYAEKNVTADPAFLRRTNIAYFAAAAQRNEKREKALADPALLDEVDQLISDYHRIARRWQALTAYEAPLAAVQYRLEKVLGLDES